MTGIDSEWIGDQPLLRLAFDSNEATILGEIADQFIRLVTDAPDDPAATGLFPNGYADPAAQAEFSRFTRTDLSERKIAAATAVRDALRGPEADGVVVSLEPTAAWEWLTFLTDIRLVLAVRLHEAEGEPEHELQRGVYDWAAYVQGAMIDELSAISGAESSL
ncbi:MAG: DUF2017 family protein [Microbacteriaceae bacterium]